MFTSCGACITTGYAGSFPTYIVLHLTVFILLPFLGRVDVATPVIHQVAAAVLLLLFIQKYMSCC